MLYINLNDCFLFLFYTSLRHPKYCTIFHFGVSHGLVHTSLFAIFGHSSCLFYPHFLLLFTTLAHMDLHFSTHNTLNLRFIKTHATQPSVHYFGGQKEGVFSNCCLTQCFQCRPTSLDAVFLGHSLFTLLALPVSTYNGYI